MQKRSRRIIVVVCIATALLLAAWLIWRFTGVYIRIENASNYDFSNIVVSRKAYGDLKKGQFSGYQRFKRAYSYAHVILKIDGREYRIQPADYVGETPLSAGPHTYVLTLDEKGDHLGIKLQPD